MYNKLFTRDHLKFLYSLAIAQESQIIQWLDMKDYSYATKYAHQLEALVALMENITVFNVGDGLDNFKGKGKNKNIHERLHSFDNLWGKT